MSEDNLANQKKVLIVVHTNTFFIELFRLAKLLKSFREYAPTVLFAYPYPTCLDDVSRCAPFQIPCINTRGELITEQVHGGQTAESLAALEGKRSRLLPERVRKILKPIYYRTIGFLYRIRSRLIGFYHWFVSGPLAREYRSFLNSYNVIRNVLFGQSPSLLVLGGDMAGYDTSIYIDVARQMNIPVVILPSTMSNGLEQAEAYFHDPNYGLGRLINRFVAVLYPKWVREHRGRKLLRVPGERVLVMEHFGLAPPLPWIFNSGFADTILVESEFMKKYYLECGIPKPQLRLTGSLADDVMIDILRQKKQKGADLCRELGLSDDKPILLSALPPDSFYMKGGRPESEFYNYRELVEFWVKSIGRVKNYNVVICLHPSVKVEDFLYIEDWGVKIAQNGSAALVPLCDLYVASVSSTIRWAIACAVPVINYDVYRHHYTDYLGVNGVINIDAKTEFECVLNKITGDPDFYQRQKLEQERSAGQWGMFDGKVGVRIQELFDAIIALRGKENI